MGLREIAPMVAELEREADRERRRAEVAEGKLKLYEHRDRARSIAVAASTDVDYKIRFKTESHDTEQEIAFSPGLWLLVMAEKYLQEPQALSLIVEPLAAAQPISEQKEREES